MNSVKWLEDVKRWPYFSRNILWLSTFDMGIPAISKASRSSYQSSLISLGNADPLGLICLSLLFTKSTIFWSFFLLSAITSFDLICFRDAICVLTELFFFHTVFLQASHVSLPDTTVRCFPLNWFNLSRALTFGLAVPRDISLLFSMVSLPFMFSWNGRFLWSTQPCACFCCYPQKICRTISVNSKKTGTIPRSTRLHHWKKPTWGQPCRSKTRMRKSCIKPLLFIDK